MTATAATSTVDEGRLSDLLAALTLEEKVGLLTGRDVWTTHPIDRIGLRAIVVSDGPSGVRGVDWDERSPSLSLPSATALAASWDRSLARRYGAVLAVEARRKGVDVVLGPTINLHRSPLGGRSFEAYSEDPVLTAEVAAAYVRGMQDNGVGATPKHYVGNDYETERLTASTEVDERTLREVYLLPFEKAVVDAGAWLVMSAYNAVNGVTVSESELLATPLRTEWGFDGVVVSDWGAVRSLASARAEQDLAMPGPHGPWGAALVAAVRSGEVGQAAVDRKVLRLLRLAARVGALEGFAPAEARAASADDGPAFAREVAAAGTVLVRNETVDGFPVLPVDPTAVSSVAVIGHHARAARNQGGGAATVLPEAVVTPLLGIAAAFPNATVTYAVGAVVPAGVTEVPLERMTNPVTGGPGLRVAYLGADGVERFVEDRRATTLVWLIGDERLAGADVVRLSLRYTPDRTATLRAAVSCVGRVTVAVDGAVVLDEALTPTTEGVGATLLSPPVADAPINVHHGQIVDLVVEYAIAPDLRDEPLGLTFGLEVDEGDPDRLLESAARVAAEADVAIVVVGTNARVESEGFDRTSLALPGRQDDLVRRVAAANPRTVVVVNSGAPVVLPWRDEVGAILVSWFGGQEFGHALADVLTGRVEPGGRLPTTWPAAQADVPVIDVTPRAGRLHYDEGVHIGYRAWLRAGRSPAYAFGHGLGYTTWTLAGASVEPAVTDGGSVTVSVDATNTGSRAGRHVVQVYASRPDSRVDRPARWLVGFATVTADAGRTARVRIDVPARAFAHWQDGGWAHEPGEVILHVGSAVDALPLTLPVRVVAAAGPVDRGEVPLVGQHAEEQVVGPLALDPGV
jgi:beta-glucosidase